MTNKKDETGKGTPQPGECRPKRPYATIDLKATEVGGPRTSGAAGRAAARRVFDARRIGQIAGRGRSAKPSAPHRRSPAVRRPAGRSGEQRCEARSRRCGARWHCRRRAPHAPSVPVPSAPLLVVVGAQLLTPSRPPALARGRAISRGAGRHRERARHTARRPACAPGSRSWRARIGALGDAQAKLARETKALDAKLGSGPRCPGAGRPARQAGKRSARCRPATQQASRRRRQRSQASSPSWTRPRVEASEAGKSGSPRVDSDLVRAQDRGGRLGQRLDALKGDVEERFKGAAKAADLAPVAAKLAAFEQDLQGFLKGEGERTANAQQVLLTLEIANLKRAMDRGDRYAEELARAKKAGRRHRQPRAARALQPEGVPSLRELAKDLPQGRQRHARCRSRAGRCLPARPADVRAPARSCACARPATAADDTSAEAVLARMEAALKDGRLGEVLAQGQEAAAQGGAGRRGLAAGRSRRATPSTRPSPTSRPRSSPRSGAAAARASGAQAMIRLVLFLLGILAIAAGLHWLADRPGTITIEWLGYIAETSVFRAFIILAAAAGRDPRSRGRCCARLWRSPAALGRFLDRRRQKRGLDALTERHHRRRRRRPARSPSAMPPRRARRCRTSRSRICCAPRPPRSAATAPPRGASSRPCWPRPTPSSSACAACSWRPSGRASAKRPGSSPSARCSSTPSSAGRWRRCSTCNAAPPTGRARSTRSRSRERQHLIDKALGRPPARRAAHGAGAGRWRTTPPTRRWSWRWRRTGWRPIWCRRPPSPAASWPRAGNTPRAARVLLKTWRLAPHPDLAAAYAYARPGDSPRDRLNRVRHLAPPHAQPYRGADRGGHQRHRGARLGRGAQGAGAAARGPPDAARVRP